MQAERQVRSSPQIRQRTVTGCKCVGLAASLLPCIGHNFLLGKRQGVAIGGPSNAPFLAGNDGLDSHCDHRECGTPFCTSVHHGWVTARTKLPVRYRVQSVVQTLSSTPCLSHLIFSLSSFGWSRLPRQTPTTFGSRLWLLGVLFLATTSLQFRRDCFVGRHRRPCLPTGRLLAKTRRERSIVENG